MGRTAAFLKLTNQQILALTIYGEARGETRAGKIAVGSVILERVGHRDWDGKTIPEVCLMKWQFSCYLENDPNYGKLQHIAEQWDAALATDKALNECYAIAWGLIDGTVPRIPIIAENDICQYVETGYRQAVDKQALMLSGDDFVKFNKSRWWIRMKLAATIGHHEFYA